MRTLKITLAILAVTSLSILNSCRISCKRGSGTIATDHRTVSEFTGINVSGDFKVILKQDSSFSVTVNADDNLMQYIQTEVDGDDLRIKSRKRICSDRPIEVIVGVKHLEDLKGSGAIEVLSDGKLNLKDLSINLAGATHVTLDVNANEITTKGSGSTELALTGQAARHMVDLTGAGKLDAFNLVVGTYDLETTGSAECRVNALNDLNIHITGSGEVQYRGNPANVNTKKTGAATVTKVD